MKEILSVHIGGYGCRLSNQLWETLYQEEIQSTAMFDENFMGAYKPRAVLCDLDDEVIQ